VLNNDHIIESVPPGLDFFSSEIRPLTEQTVLQVQQFKTFHSHAIPVEVLSQFFYLQPTPT
jgi:hypothetical protein